MTPEQRYINDGAFRYSVHQLFEFARSAPEGMHDLRQAVEMTEKLFERYDRHIQEEQRMGRRIPLRVDPKTPPEVRVDRGY